MPGAAGVWKIRRYVSLLSAALALTAVFPCVHAQQQLSPHIGYVYPAGGKQGSSFQVKLGGQFLDGATNAFVSGDGVKATVLEHTKPLTTQQFNALRDKLKELQEKMASRRKGGTNSWSYQDQKQIAEIRMKLANFQRRPANPAIAETVTLQVALAAEAEPGERELRLQTAQGLSNPLKFCLGQLPEFRKKELGKTNEMPFQKGFKKNAETHAVPPTESTITLPAVVNGQILPGGVDRYRFQARKGQKLVIVVRARDLIPYLPDAVPGWFQPNLTLLDAKGRELACDDRYRFHPDPVIAYDVPKDGEFVFQIRDSIYRGREDFVYRITIGELPFITSLFPLGGKVGAATAVELQGWNLPETHVTQEAKAPGIYSISVRKGALVSNPVPFAAEELPDLLEAEPNNAPEAAQAVTLPVVVNGRMEKPGDQDVFRFEGHAGEQFVAEVYARRLDSPLDSILRLTDASGRQLALNDDHEDKGSGLNTHHADSYLAATLPADGAYYVHLGDTQRQGGPEYAYRLRLSAPRPDFALRLTPSSINARPGVSTALTVYALRRDGFTNEITLALKDAPSGCSLGGGWVPANQDKVQVTLAVPLSASRKPVSISLEGRATIAGHEVVRPVIPAEDMMQAFAYRHLVPSQELEVATLGLGRQANPRATNSRFAGQFALRILDPTPVKIPAGGTARVRVGAPFGGFTDRWQLELSEPPEGLTLQKVAPGDRGAELVFQAEAAKAKPGLQGNLIVNVVPGQNAPSAQKNKKQNPQRRAAVGVLPAIPFEIVR